MNFISSFFLKSMRFQVYSDLHLEHETNHIPQVLCDNLIIAWDVSKSNNVIENLTKIASAYKHVIFVPGNHDYHFSTIPKMHQLFLESLPSNVHYLYPGKVVTIDTIKFVWCTLWFGNEWSFDYRLSDVDLIGETSIAALQELGRDHLQWLAQNVDADSVVITHYIPSLSFIDESWHSYFKNNSFYNECIDIITQQKPKAWIYGHTHTSHETFVWPTHILCNPVWYPHEQTTYRDMYIDI